MNRKRQCFVCEVLCSVDNRQIYLLYAILRLSPLCVLDGTLPISSILQDHWQKIPYTELSIHLYRSAYAAFDGEYREVIE